MVVAAVAEADGVAGDEIDARCQVGVAGHEMGLGVGERVDEIGGVVVSEGLGEEGQRRLGLDREVVEGGDLPGELSQMGGVGPAQDATMRSAARRLRVACTRCSPVAPGAPGRTRR